MAAPQHFNRVNQANQAQVSCPNCKKLHIPAASYYHNLCQSCEMDKAAFPDIWDGLKRKPGYCWWRGDEMDDGAARFHKKCLVKQRAWDAVIRA